ncbi:hypothetical protein FF098_000060 [Parvularcula flava]|uniref:Uncharacterized protein n=1 Tax=Aquisalinus luteolus TaxID=1566827 RepID=A0A8J3A0Z3_9PROT|nr:hypothetical protein [Aquisalinus luteolus]NHK26294.1 hypothetical protein [Aquisalinus luteolus]GGH91896.1 hypothetical protein GCM10011355_00120 [Aquisalinus luteolus]
MNQLRNSLASGLTAFLIMLSGTAVAEEPAWWEPLVCAEIEPDAPAGSRETARKVDLTDLFTDIDAVADTYDNLNYGRDDALPPPLPKETLSPNCQWVELEGYFRPIRYHDYRGQMLSDVRDHYLGGSPIGMLIPHFWVFNWAEDNISSHELHNRRLRIRARVHDQCLAILQYDRQQKENLFRFGGACHYGENTGMILTDVEVIEVLSPEKIIASRPDLSDVLEMSADDAALRYPSANQKKFQPLHTVEGLPDAAFTLVRGWIRRVQLGAGAAIQKEQEDDRDVSEERLADLRELYAHPDGAYGYMNAKSGFAKLNPETAKITFIATRPFGEWTDAPRKWVGYGCVALSPDVRWPVAEIDASEAIATFACTEVSFWENGEWEGGY